LISRLCGVDVGSLTSSLVASRGPVFAGDQVACPSIVLAGRGGADFAAADRSGQALGPHQALDGAVGYL
jgi:hypothetical protein